MHISQQAQLGGPFLWHQLVEAREAAHLFGKLCEQPRPNGRTRDVMACARREPLARGACAHGRAAGEWLPVAHRLKLPAAEARYVVGLVR